MNPEVAEEARLAGTVGGGEVGIDGESRDKVFNGIEYGKCAAGADAGQEGKRLLLRGP